MKILFIFFLIVTLSFSQPLPHHIFSHKAQLLLNDAGEGWEDLSTIISKRYPLLKVTSNQDNDNLKILTKVGFYGNNTNFNYHSSFKLSFKNYVYGYLFPGITSRSYKSNKHLISLELNQLIQNINNDTYYGAGYQNQWVTLQIGKGRENWSAGNDIQLALDFESDSYDYFLLSSDYNKVRVNYFHGFLETTDLNVNRYISGKGIEWTNKKSLVIGISEIVVYSGENRSFDFGYLNPISSHLEVDLNNRSNQIGSQNSNGIWQAHLDWLLFKKLRISGNLLFDEYVLDPEQEIGKEHGNGFSVKIVLNNFKPASNNNVLSFYSSIIKIGTPTFRHSIGTNNLINNGKPIGWKFGSDGYELNSGINFFNRQNLITSISLKTIQIGEESIIKRAYEPYKDYIKGKFPSGRLNKIKTFNLGVDWNWKPDITLFLKLGYSREISSSIDFNLRIHAYFNNLIKI